MCKVDLVSQQLYFHNFDASVCLKGTQGPLSAIQDSKIFVAHLHQSASKESMNIHLLISHYQNVFIM